MSSDGQMLTENLITDILTTLSSLTIGLTNLKKVKAAVQLKKISY